MEDAQVNRATTACERCREQKIRCSHEQPGCARCVRLDLDCVYPEPPDRRLIAARRLPPRKRPSPHKGDNSHPMSTPDPKRRRSEWSDISTLNDPRAYSASSAVTSPAIAIPDEARKLLIDTYFTCAFNSSLVLHRPTFEQAVLDNVVPTYTLLAMYALAANFLAPFTTRDRRQNNILRSLGDLRIASRQWAMEAGRTVLQHMDLPTIYMIQTCQMLSLYWFTQGDSRRNDMFSAFAYRAVRAIVIESKETRRETTAASAQISGRHRAQSLEAESLRRLFWAAWITSVISSDHYTPGSAADTLVLTLPLPVSEEAFFNNTEEPLATISDAHDASRDHQKPRIMAELLKILHLWARIRDHIEMRRCFPKKEAWVNAFTLQNELSTCASQLAPELTYSKRNLYHQLIVQQQPVYVMLHALHQQCCLVLNASLVPHFSGLLVAPGMPVEVVRVSASIALRSAQTLSDMSADLVALDWDPTQVAPFVGYCMYVAASIHLAVLPQESESGKEWENLTKCLRLLKLMKPYWAVLDRLWARIQQLYDAQAGNARTVSIDGQDELTSPQRDTGDLTEPLENSVLHYSLRKLQRDGDSETGSSPNSGGLDRALRSSTARPTAERVIRDEEHAQHAQHRHGPESIDSTLPPSPFPRQTGSRPATTHIGLVDQQLQQDMFPPVDLAFQDPAVSILPSNFNWLDEDDSFQFDIESSAQARQAFHDLV